jgi:hypothetical protein
MACGVVEYKSKAIKQHSDGAFKMAEYAIPTDVRTTVETDTLIVQIATMLSADDAKLYAKQCNESGDGDNVVASYTGLEVTVFYKLDADGKIGV